MKQGFFGVKNTHIAIMTDEDALTYATPIHIPGTVSISADKEINTDTSYADNEVWIDSQVDNGFTGSITFFDTVSTVELRELFAELTGYEVDSHGRVIGVTNKAPKPFALMCERPGSRVGQRRCWMKCQLTKPNMEAETQEDSPEIAELEYEFTARPVTLENGVQLAHYDDYSDTDTYSAFFNAVVTEHEAAQIVYTLAMLEALPLARILAIATERGYEITATSKADVIDAFLAAQAGN